MPTCWFSTTFSPDRPAKRPVGAVALPPGKGAVASGRRLRALPRKTQPSSAERHRASRAGRLRPERPYGSQLFSLPPTYKPPTEKVRPCAHPPRRSAPGRIGRAMLCIATGSAPKLGRVLPMAGRTPPHREARTASFTASLYPKRNLPGARPEQLLRPTVFARAPWRFILFRQVRNS